MLQCRIFAYGDTQRYMHGPNYLMLPINTPKCAHHNNHYDGAMNFMHREEEFLLSLLEDKPRMKASLEGHKKDLEPNKSFVATDHEEDDKESDNGDESNNEIDLYDSICAFCDNGGELLCCEGGCMRSFHATTEDGADLGCTSLGYSKDQVKAIQHFLCKNCECKRHQCFICGKLGSSDKSAGAEVFACVNATCGYFYHPTCVSNWLFPDDIKQAAYHKNKVAKGESFTCPAHKCHVCKQGENKEIKDLQFAVCWRCPTSYHRSCLPRKIAFDDRRVWEGLLPDRILIYCLLKHEIATRNHVVFPRTETKRNSLNWQRNRSEPLFKKIKFISDLYESTCQMASNEKETENLVQNVKILLQKRNSTTKVDLNLQKQMQAVNMTLFFWKLTYIFDVGKTQTYLQHKCVDVSGDRTHDGDEVIMSSYSEIDSQGKKRIANLMESKSNSKSLEDIIKKRKMPSTHSGTSSNLDKYITRGKLEGSVKVAKTALAKLEDGGSMEDAKAVCEPNVINFHKVDAYLAPFTHGMHYTSFDRSFTKVDKLSEICDKLQWYVQDDDMIVDFCCGANDFSRLMKEKLDSEGKKCYYKNYDIMQPKFDLNFENRDWMTVRPDELPSGSRLIMGLNPPYGERGELANQFIDKALTFKPKLIILIVPNETERLDQKSAPYDLVWENSENLSAKSFYLPGSVDENNMQTEQLNNKPPKLYLWSRPDWSKKHKTIASKKGHISDALTMNNVIPDGYAAGPNYEYRRYNNSGGWFD